MVDARRRHNRYQYETFDSCVDFFKEEIPQDVQQRLQQIVDVAGLTCEDAVLDVGTGIGALIPYIQARGVRRVVGCDLSGAMLAEAEKCYPHVTFWCGDIVDFPLSFGHFDAIFFNAVFGNVWDQRDTLVRAIQLLSNRGRIIISHPMGSAFVSQLSREDPSLVPHTLPSMVRLTAMIDGLELDLCHLQDEASLYLCVLRLHPPGAAREAAIDREFGGANPAA
jgi:riboflavin kinase